MTQRFTVELERIDVLRTTLEVMAADIAQATIRAQRVEQDNPKVWNVDRGAALVCKITAHANKRGAL
jgi:type II secretory pathway component PulJ